LNTFEINPIKKKRFLKQYFFHLKMKSYEEILTNFCSPVAYFHAAVPGGKPGAGPEEWLILKRFGNSATDGTVYVITVNPSSPPKR
jgi:hypothetical protein